MNVQISRTHKFKRGLMNEEEFQVLLIKLNSFAHLPVGWHYGEGGPIPKKTVKEAIRVARDMQLMGAESIQSFAGCEYEISLETDLGSYSVEVIIENDGSLTVVCDYDDRQILYISDLDYDSALKAIERQTGARAWSSLEFFIPGITTSIKNDLIALHSETSGGAFPLSIVSAFGELAQVFPTTYGNIMTVLPLSHQYFGSSTERYCPPHGCIEEAPSANGDPCHRNVHGLSDKVLREFFVRRQATDWKDFLIHDKDGCRSVTHAELERRAKL